MNVASNAQLEVRLYVLKNISRPARPLFFKQTFGQTPVVALNVSALPMTLAEESAMAEIAMSGESNRSKTGQSTPAAIGPPAVL
ncbi:hypothetical protein [Phyllobacterium sp. SB3]|uniref:hypothetical protein n=1 Tax=Phyllobacterium sp. SB3 TaxID=3156073 RepID=UPI0032AF6594